MQPPAAADQITPHYNSNNNFALDQISAFLGGGIGEHTGGFVQFTYSDIPNASHLDNTDLRPYTTTFDLSGSELRECILLVPEYLRRDTRLAEHLGARQSGALHDGHRRDQ